MFVVCWLLFDVCFLAVARCVLFVVISSLCVVRCVSFGGCCLLLAEC